MKADSILDDPMFTLHVSKAGVYTQRVRLRWCKIFISALVTFIGKFI